VGIEMGCPHEALDEVLLQNLFAAEGLEYLPLRGLPCYQGEIDLRKGSS